MMETQAFFVIYLLGIVFVFHVIKFLDISCKKTDVGSRERSALIKTTFIDKIKYFRSRKFKRGLLGRYGRKSGVNPGIAWPTEKDLDLGMKNRNSDLIWVLFFFVYPDPGFYSFFRWVRFYAKFYRYLVFSAFFSWSRFEAFFIRILIFYALFSCSRFYACFIRIWFCIGRKYR